MILFVLLAAVAISGSENLNRAYLPPPGTFQSGGNSEILQTPYENKITLVPAIQNGNKLEGNVIFSEDSRESANVFSNYSLKHVNQSVKHIPLTVTGNPDSQFQITLRPSIEPTITTLSPGKSFTTRTPVLKFNKLSYSKNQQDFSELMQDKSYYDFAKTPNYAEDQNYNITKLSDIVRPVFLKPEHTIIPSINETKIPSSLKNKIKKIYKKRPERLQTESDRKAFIVTYENIINPEGYSYSFNTSNGIQKDQSATTKNGVRALGSYSYTGDDGKIYKVIYSADENGFQPRGNHLPTPPPIPKAIQSIIEQAKRDKEAGIIHDGTWDEDKYGHLKYQRPINRYLNNKQTHFGLQNAKTFAGKMHTASKHVKHIDTEGHKIDNITKINTQNKYNLKYNSPVNMNRQFGMRIKPYLSRKKPNIGTSILFTGVDNNAFINTKKIMMTPVSSTRRKIFFGGLNNNAHENRQPDKTNQNNIFYLKLNKNTVLKTSDKHTSKTKITENLGYLYFPPTNIFTEGRLQHEPKDIAISKYEDIYYNEPLTEMEYNKVSPKQNKNRYIEKNGNANGLYTEETGDGDKLLHENVNPKSLLNENILKISTSTPYGSTESIIDNQDQHKGTVYTELIDDTFLPTENYLGIETYQSTTSMPLMKETQNPINFPKNEYYSQTTPESDLTDFYEDIPSSTIKYNMKIDGNQKEFTLNIKVDGFGRPIQDDSKLYNTASRNGNTFFATNADIKTNYGSEMFKLAANNNDYHDQYTEIPATETTTTIQHLSDDFTDQEGDNVNFRTYTISGPITGEDFSGPKQSQNYDPQTGYFY